MGSQGADHSNLQIASVPLDTVDKLVTVVTIVDLDNDDDGTRLETVLDGELAEDTEEMVDLPLAVTVLVFRILVALRLATIDVGSTGLKVDDGLLTGGTVSRSSSSSGSATWMGSLVGGKGAGRPACLRCSRRLSRRLCRGIRAGRIIMKRTVVLLSLVLWVRWTTI
jgi:hypothetical protein